MVSSAKKSRRSISPDSPQPATIRSTSCEIVAACPRIPVMIDSGFRRGTDVLKALALGARFVFVGRPFAFALSVAGEDGVMHAARILGSEIARDLALLGVTSLEALPGAGVLRRT